MKVRRWSAAALTVFLLAAQAAPIYARESSTENSVSAWRVALLTETEGAVKVAQGIVKEKPAEEESAEEEPAAAAVTGQDVVEYALQFLGNPYVYGGSSLTEGVDCSGFVQQVYLHFGYELTHSTYTQIDEGIGVSYQEAKPGDLILYDGHVALYMGDKKIVHASDWSTGIIISDDAEQWPIIAVRRIIY